MNKPNKSIINNIYIATYSIILFFLLYNLGYLLNGLSELVSIVSPIIIGFIIAFLLNILVRVYEEKIFSFINKKKFKNPLKIKRPLSIIASLITLVAVISLLAVYIFPQLLESVSTLIDTIPGYIKSLEEFIMPIVNDADILSPIWDKIVGAWQEILQSIGQILSGVLNSVVSTTVSATSTIIKFFVGVVFAIYMLLTKESLIFQGKKILYSIMKKERVESLISVGRLINVTFTKFFAGQLIEAVIIGCLCVIGMLIFGMPYPLLIGTIIGITNMLPVVGPFIGAIPSTFIIFMVDPTQAFWFVVFVLVLQQLESNLIYPRVVGTSIGLSALWVLVAITVGGNLGGAVGMLVAVPSMAVIYKLVARSVNKKLAKKNINVIPTELEKEAIEEDRDTEV